MGFLDSYRLNKAITRLLAAPSVTSPEAVQAVSTLKRFGKVALPKLIEGLGKAQHPRVLLTVLESYVQNATLPFFAEGLASANTRVVAWVVELLGQSQTYDPNRLLDFWNDPRIPKAPLGKLLTTHQERLDGNVVLRCLDTTRADERPLLLDLLAKLATADLIPALIQRLTSKDATIRLAMARTLARFDTQEPQAAVVRAAESVPSTLPPGHALKPRLDITALEPGMVLGERYRVIRHIGQGGFGTVVLVEDLMVHEQLILKFLFPYLAADERMLARFIHELRYARRVSHANVIRIHDFLKIDQAYAISMEYFPSQSLSDELRNQAPLALPRGLWIAFHVCRGMHAAHQAQIIHRDLKPPNILINDAGLVKIVDFGLAAVSNDTAARLTKTGALLGTPLYMAPEQVQNHTIDARVDIYSLGIIMYEIFTGTPPYTGENPMAVLFQHVAGKAIPPREINPAIPKPLEAIILQAMAAEPDQRFQTMEALGKQLAPLLKQDLR